MSGGQHPELPEPVLTVANQLWDRALAYAENRFEEQRQLLQQRERELREQAQVAQQGGHQALQELQSQNGRLLERCELLSDEKHALEQKLLKADEQSYRMGARVDELEHQLRQQRAMSGEGGGSEALIEARVRLSIQDEELQRLRRLNDELNRENAALRQKIEK